jgi:hypothetical protein
MSDAFEDEMERRQKLIAEKLAELGITVQGPIPFMKIPQGPLGGQIPFTWDDTKPLQAALEADDEFAQIAAAVRAEELAEREEARKQAEAQAFADLQALTADDDDDDDDD